MVTINEQAFLFLTCVQTGIIMGMLYDLIRILRKIIHHPNWLVQIEDLLYWITCGCFAFIMVYWENYGQIRVFIFIGILIGAILYFCTASILFMKVATWTIYWTKKVLKKIISFVLIPIKCIIVIMNIPYRYVWRAYDGARKYKRSQIRKARNKWRRRRAKWRAQWKIVKDKK